MGTKKNPSPYDCYTKALPNEEMFVLLARDRLAPAVVRYWIELKIANGHDKDDPKMIEAGECADRMEEWYRTFQAPHEKNESEKQST